MSETNASLINKIKALFAKAESTEHEAEAEAFTAKAQELLARHNLDRRSLGEDVDGHEIIEIRVPLTQNAYMRARVLLLDAVSEPNGVFVAYQSKDRRLGTGAYAKMRGRADTVEMVHMLFTQIDGMVSSRAARITSDGVTDTRTLRRSYVMGFAATVRERLEAANAKVDAETEEGTLLPMIASDLARSRAGVRTRTAKVAGIHAEAYANGQSDGHGADIGQTRVAGTRAALTA